MGPRLKTITHFRHNHVFNRNFLLTPAKLLSQNFIKINSIISAFSDRKANSRAISRIKINHNQSSSKRTKHGDRKLQDIQ